MSFIKLKQKIEDQSFFIVSEEDCSETSHGYMVEPRGLRHTFYVFADEDEAGRHVRDYWQDFIESDPDEAVNMLGAENLIQWALGRAAGPGSAKVCSLKEWLDLHLSGWDEHFEDVYEVDAISEDLEDLIGFKPTIVAVF